MRKSLYMVLLASLVLLAGCQNHSAGSVSNGSGSTDGPGHQVKQFLNKASVEPPKGGILKALIVPAGTSPDAQAVAAYGYKALDGLRFDTVVLVRQTHAMDFIGASVYKGEDFETSFGPIRIDRKLADHLVDPDAGVFSNPVVAKDKYVDTTHLAFLKHELGECKVVPVLIGRLGQKAYVRLMAVLSTEATRRGKRVLLIAMTDLAKGNEGGDMDDRTIESLKGLKPAETQRLLRLGDAELSGGDAALVVVEAARRAGADTAEVFNYKKEKAGDSQGTGHVAMGFYDRPLDDAERVELLTIAWRTVEASAMGKGYVPHVESPRLLAPGAAFVTLMEGRRLRGGMGQVQATGPLYKSVIMSAEAAAMKDDRFFPVSVSELNDLSYEVSVLTPLVPVLDVRKDIELGTHGLYLRLDGHSGMLLPQVPVEQRWDLNEYLRQISLRAGLSPDAWKNKDARLWSFTTEIVR